MLVRLMFDNESLQNLNGPIIHIMLAILYVFHLPRGPLSRVAIRVAIVNIRPVAGEANSNAVHPPCRIRIIIRSNRYTFQRLVQVHIQIDTSPSIRITKDSTKLPCRSLNLRFGTTPIPRHARPQVLVDAIGDSDARVDGLRHVDQRQSKNRGRFVELCAAPGGGLLAFPVGLEGGGLHGEARAEGVIVGSGSVPKGGIVGGRGGAGAEAIAEDDEGGNDGSDHTGGDDEEPKPTSSIERFGGWRYLRFIGKATCSSVSRC